MHAVQLSGGRDALVVVLRPLAFVVELEEGCRGEDCLAA
jgi:hypothetical protein